ncbi:MAG: hypothetical protein RIQ79_251 [Verrucomicrobiota bacterium]
MESFTPSTSSAGYTEWQGSLKVGRSRSGHRWRRLLWMMIYPRRSHRIMPTLTGVLLIVVSMGIGMAAYNTANNILFITLSLLLSCLVLSGVMSWLNMRCVAWRLQAAGPWRAGQAQTVGLELRNAKTLLPTYGLWFDIAAGNAPGVRRHLSMRLDPGRETRMEWPIVPDRRGPLTIHLRGVGSLFPFGFLRKTLASELMREVLVWPAPVEYRRHSDGASWREQSSEGRVNRSGSGDDLLALRRYSPGDSPRLVNWKASARLQHLMVRQFSAEGLEGFTLWVRTDAERWTRAEQFELALSLAATLAEDLFQMERLQALVIDNEPPLPVRRMRDVETFLDRLARLETKVIEDKGALPVGTHGEARRRIMVLEPQGPRGVAAMIDGKLAATA